MLKIVISKTKSSLELLSISLILMLRGGLYSFFCGSLVAKNQHRAIVDN
jgi:hypothetical protein